MAYKYGTNGARTTPDISPENALENGAVLKMNRVVVSAAAPSSIWLGGTDGSMYPPEMNCSTGTVRSSMTAMIIL